MNALFSLRLRLPSAILLVLATASSAQADYKSTILADSPSAYYRLSDWPTNYASATNLGSAGVAARGQYYLGVGHGAPGAIVGDPSTSAQFNGLGRVEVPFAAALNPSGPFSVECWAMVTNPASTTIYRSPVTSRDSGSPNNRGFIIYAGSNNRWQFWTGGGGGYTNLGGPVVDTNVWVHVVGTRDSLGTNRLYVNGVLTASMYAPNYAPNLSRNLRIGAGASEGRVGDFFFPGRVDEVTVYATQLSDAQVAAHYNNGTNAARSVPYSQLILNDSPVGYWRLDDAAPSPAPTAPNLGTLGALGNGSYHGSPETVLPGQPGAIVGDPDYAMGFSNATTTPFGARIEAPFNSALNPTTFSAEAWAYFPSLYRDNQAVISTRDVVSSTTRGFVLYANSNATTGLKWQFYTGRLLNSWNVCTATNSILLNTWNHIVGTYDGTYQFLYVNSELVGFFRPILPYVPNTGAPLRIGAGANESARGDFYVNGGVDDVAVYGTPLSQSQIATHYANAFGSPPAITTIPVFALDPQPATNQIGGAIRLEAVALGGVPMQYQWFRDGTPVLGQTSYILNIANAGSGDSGSYQLGATNAAGNALSSPAYVQILPPSAPLLTLDLPPNMTVYAGGSPKLEVKVAGSAPFSYQWSSNGVVLPGVTGSTLTLSNVTASVAGSQFQVVVTNLYGGTNSAISTVSVAAPNPASYTSVMLAASPLSYWRLGEDSSTTTAFDYWGGNNGLYVSALQHYTPGALGLDDDGAMQLTGTGSYMVVSNSAAYDFSGTNAFTLMAWVKPDALTGIQRVFSIRRYWTNTAPSGFGFGFNAATGLRFTAFGIVDVNMTAPTAAGQWQHIAVARSGTSVVLYHNGVALGTNTAVITIIPSGLPLRLGGNPDPGGGEEFLTGAIDEAAIFGGALTGPQIRALYDSRNGARPNIPQPPQSMTVYAGGTARFTVGAAGTPPLAYLWKSNNVAIPGQTNATLVLTNLPTGASGSQYSVTVTNLAGSSNSAAATLMVATPTGYAARVVEDRAQAYYRLSDPPGPLVHDIWASHDGTTNGNVTFQVPGALLADSDSAMNFDGTSATRVQAPFYPELNPPTFTVEAWARVIGGAGRYRAVVSSRDLNEGYILYAANNNTWQFWTRAPGVGWQTLSGPAVVDSEWVHLAGTFDGSNKVFYVNGEQVAGEVNLNYAPNPQRSLRIAAGNNEGSASEDYNFPGDIDDVAIYDYPLSADRIAIHYGQGRYGTTTPPFFVRKPAGVTVGLGSTVTLTGLAGGSPLLGYQWWKDGAPLVGATQRTLVFTNAGYSVSGSYLLVATNLVGSTNSEPAQVAVMPAPQFCNLTNSLVLHLKFDGSTADSSGRGNNGTAMNSPTFAAGKIGSQALRYNTDIMNGLYSYVSLGTPADLMFSSNVNFSVACWVRLPAGAKPGPLPFLCSAANSLGGWGYTFSPYYTNGAWAWSLGPGLNNLTVSGTANSINDGNWHHLVHSIERTGVAATYLDGVLVDSRASATLAADLDNGQIINIGQDPGGFLQETATVDLDDLGVWRRALNDYEAQSIYTVAQNYGASFDTYGPMRILLNPTPGGLEIIWQAGTLLQADDVNGPWSPVPGAAAPYFKVVPGIGNKFYRVKL